MKRILVFLFIFALFLPVFAMEFNFSPSAPKRLAVYLGPHFGGGDTGLNFGVEGDLFVNENIFIGLAFDYISSSSKENYWYHKYEYTFSNVSLTGLGGYRYPVIDKLDVYGSAKFGLGYTSWESNYGGISKDGSDISYAFILEGGARYKLTEQFDVGALLKYTVWGNTYSHAGDIDGITFAVEAGYSF
jgi:hypothetical protein